MLIMLCCFKLSLSCFCDLHESTRLSRQTMHFIVFADCARLLQDPCFTHCEWKTGAFWPCVEGECKPFRLRLKLHSDKGASWNALVTLTFARLLADFRQHHLCVIQLPLASKLRTASTVFWRHNLICDSATTFDVLPGGQGSSWGPSSKKVKLTSSFSPADTAGCM